jgi:hypothetical protein
MNPLIKLLYIIIFSAWLISPHIAVADTDITNIPATKKQLTPIPTIRKLEEMPKALRGFWGTSECRDSYLIIINTHHFMLFVEETMPIIVPLLEVKKAADFFYINTGSMIFAARTADEDKMIQNINYLELRNFHEDMKWEDFKVPVNLEFTNCKELFVDWEVLDNDGLKAFRSMDKLYESCAGEMPIATNNKCHNIAFAEADNNKDGLLSSDELEQLFKKVTYLYTARKPGTFSSLFLNESKKTGQKFAVEIIGALDSDGSKNLSIDETRNGWPKIIDTETGKIFAEYLVPTLSLLTLVPEGTEGPTCFAPTEETNITDKNISE